MLERFFNLYVTTIRARLMFWFLIMALIPLVVMMAIFYFSSELTVRREVERNLSNLLTNRLRRANQYREERQDDVHTLALLPTTIEFTTILSSTTNSGEFLATYEKTRNFFGKYAELSPFKEFYLFNQDGGIVVSTHALPEVIHEGSLAAFAEVRQTGLPYHSPFVYNETEQEWNSYVAAPIFNEQQEWIGAVVAVLPGQDLYRILTNPDNLGETGQIIIGGLHNNQLALFGEPLPAVGELTSVQIDLAKRALAEENGAAVLSADDNFKYVSVWKYSPEFGWGAVITQQGSEAFASIDNQWRITSALFTITFVVVIIAATGIANSLSRPIFKLTKVVKEISGGDLRTRVRDVERIDELGVLAQGINDMASQLYDFVDKLERRIWERTQQLLLTAEVSRTIVVLRDPQEAIRFIVSTLQERFDFYFVGIFLVDTNNEYVELKAAAGMASQERLTNSDRLKIGTGSIIGWVASNCRPYLAPDVAADELFLRHPLLPHTQSEIALPLLRDGVLVGILDLQSNYLNEFDEGDVQHLQGLADQITTALENGRLFQQSQQYARDMVRAREAAEEANRAKSTFLANMSHELRTPLNAIMGFSQVMERDASLSSKQQEYLHIISRSSEHLLSLINDVLEMSKIEAGQIKVNEAPFNLHDLLLDVKEMFQIRAEVKGLQMSFTVAPDVPHHVVSDEGKIRQILINLIGNAIKFTKEGGVSVRVRYEPLETAPRLHLAVEDTGVGIDTEEMKNLFRPFVQTSSGQKAQEGTGLGLAITRQFIHLLDGEISVQSQPGRGTVVQFDLQIGLARPEDVHTQKIYRRVRYLQRDRQGNVPEYRVLVVDDRPENRRLLSEWLTGVGFKVNEAANGQEAVDLWESWAPHFVWMDMRMPVMDGYQATRLIKSTPRGKTTPVLALTASALEHEKQIVLSAGCDDFIRKPVREAVIFEKMAEYLGLSYEYEELSREAENPSHEKTEPALTLDNLTQLPAEWLARLRQAADEVDVDKAQEVVAEIAPAHPHLAEELGDWINNFRFDKLQELLQEVNSP